MDWSLVLASQGIEPELHPAPGGPGATLSIPEVELGRARAILAQYQRENRHRRWQTAVARVGWVFDWQALGWVALVTLVHLLSIVDKSPLAAAGDFDSVAARGGAWWRSITALFLHVDARHLISNLTIGLVFLGVAMAEYGAGPALLASTLSGVAANWIGLAFRPEHYHGLGASGFVMAALGMISVRAFRLEEWRQRPTLTAARGVISAGFLLILFGFSPESDVLVHVAGFAVGAGLGLLLRPFGGDVPRQTRWDLPCKLGFAALVSLGWWNALQ